MKIIGKITRRDYLFLERSAESRSSTFTCMYSDESVFNGVARGRGSRVDANLVEDRAHMTLHRARANHQPFSYCAIAQTLSDQA